MNPAIVLALAAFVASASANITPVTPEQQDQQQQQSAQQQQYAQASVIQPQTVIGAAPIDVYARPAYRQVYAVADAGAQNSASEPQANLVQPQGQVLRYIPYPVQAQVIQGSAGRYLNFAPTQLNPLGLGARLGGSIHISPAARGFALGGLTGLGVGLASRGLLAGSLAGPIGLGLHGALSTPALGVGLGAGAAALLG